MIKILFIDLETSPIEAYTWGPKWETNLIEIIEPVRILSYSAKWLGGKHITKGWLDYKGYKKGVLDDTKIVKDLWHIMDEADIVIGQNSDQFDIKIMNARFLAHNLSAPSPYKQLDTKKIARRYMRLPSYSLDDMCSYFGIGRKLEHEGFGLWKKCMAGNKSAWKRMLAYNKHDVKLTEELYLKLRPYIKNHPNRALMEGKKLACPNCAGTHLQKRGFEYTRTNVYRRYQCQATGCFAWSSSRTREKTNKVEIK